MVARVVRAHGLHGEVAVTCLTSEPELRLAPGAELHRPGGPPLRVLASRPHQDRYLVTFDGVVGREAAEALRGTELTADAIEDPDALWVHELVGAPVVDDAGVERGTVRAVLPNPASDLLELDGGALVPVTFVVGWEGEGPDRRLVVAPPEGLFDL